MGCSGWVGGAVVAAGGAGGPGGLGLGGLGPGGVGVPVGTLGPQV